MKYKYNRNFDPPAPVIEVSISAPLSKVSTSSTALVDSGADITVIPKRIIAQLKLRRVDLRRSPALANVLSKPLFILQLWK